MNCCSDCDRLHVNVMLLENLMENIVSSFFSRSVSSVSINRPHKQMYINRLSYRMSHHLNGQTLGTYFAEHFKQEMSYKQ
jgi:hypothetical protein